MRTRQEEKESRAATKKMATWKKVVLLLFIAIGGGLLAGFFYVKSTLDSVVVKPREDEPAMQTKKKEGNYRLNFLFLGVDNDMEREKTGLTGTRADSIMLVSMNTATDKLKVYSIPRDTTAVIYDENNKPVKSPDGSWLNKINAAYEVGKEEATKNTIEHLFPGIKIDNYATVNFLSFKGIVDSLGGIDVNVPENIYWKDTDRVLVNAGQQTLNGTQALDMARARYQDDDIHRGYRQQIVMQAIADKASKTNDVTKLMSVFNEVKGNVRTNMQLDEMMDLYKTINGEGFSFEKIEEEWGSYNLDGASMVYIPEASRDDMVKQVNDSLTREVPTNTSENGSVRSALKTIEDQVKAGSLEFTSDYTNSLISENLLK